MSGFKALNIESDDESDIEVDDTKEIQIEEALKLYQNALKYHAEGPGSFDKAAAAYQQLFDSEIFKYPESQIELQRIELYGPLPESDEIWYDLEPGTVTGPVGLEGGPSTLPQILHLSHKNYAQFKLEALSARFEQFNFTLNQILADAKDALDHFVHALDKDDSDLELWRRTASVGQLLDSKRVARYCLESVMDGDDDALGGILSLPGLEESLAGEQLRDLVSELQDQLSLLQSPLSTSKRKVFSRLLKEQLHPYEDILRQENNLKAQGDALPAIERPERTLLKTPESWAELGDGLLRQLMAEQHGTSSAFPALAVAFDLSSTSPPVAALESAPSPQALPAPASNPILPKSVNEQFPGLDHGLPTAQPQIASADGSMHVANNPTDEDVTMMDSPTITLPSRKRSGDAAGLNDGAEEGRAKSRRTRARESNLDTADSRQAIIDANTRWEFEQQLHEFQAADDWMFETVGNLFERIGIVGFDATRHIRQDMAASADSTPSAEPPKGIQDLRVARSDIQAFLDKFNEQLAHLLLHGGENLDLGQSQSLAGAGGMFAGGGGSKGGSKLPPMPNDGLHQLLESMNEHHYLTQEAGWVFAEALLRPGKLTAESNSYAAYVWPENLKTMVVRTLVNFDEFIYKKASAELEAWKGTLNPDVKDVADLGLPEMVQTIFELHLDIYSLIKQPNSGVEADIIVTQGDRLQRWFDLAREAMHFRAVSTDSPRLEDHLNIRFLWATTSTIGTANDVSQDHVIECMNDLRTVFTAANEPTIHLPNNAIMPELSLTTLEREISKLTTKDFFLKVTSHNAQDAASVIENLEPLLEALEAARTSPSENSQLDGDESLHNVPPELLRFLENSNVSVRLLLWQRLRDAYVAIQYSPMVVYCYFRMIRMVLDELKSSDVTTTAQTERQTTVLKCVRLLHDVVNKLYEIIHSSADALECLDDTGLKLAVNGFGEILQLLQVFNVAEDSVRIGQTQAPSLSNGLPVPSYIAVTKLGQETQTKIWMMLYSLFQEALSQNPDQYPTALEDRFDFLRTVHRSLGLRGICGSCNRAFVRMLKEEFLNMTQIDGCESEQAQVLYDLHRLNCFLDPTYELIEHKCTADAFLDRNVALQAVDLLLSQASKLSVKDLIKHPIKDTIEKVHGALPRKKPTEAILRNREVIKSYLRSPINPLDLYDCLSGRRNQLPVTPVPKDDALLASKGWYFLMGQIALTRFRSVKRTGATATEDVDIAIAFFNQDLEYTGENWETWFRLAQAHDTKVEENVVWSAEKLNNNMQDIVGLQRTALHCYIMGMALAYRSADLGFETSSKITEMCYEFANRIYSSAREPFGMKAFEVEDKERFVSRPTGVGTDKSFESLTVYQAIKLVNVLYKRALPGKPDSWMIHCMIGKCLWKLHNAPDTARRSSKREPASQVLQALVRTLELLPEKDRKGDGKKEPILEPHYKLITTVHKLLTQSKTVTLEEAKETLRHTHYATKDTFPESMEEWTPYILAVLKNLRAADKSNWYHRMIFRSAQIIYNDAKDEIMGGKNLGVMGAHHEIQQIFTKTMTLQVWKPESERPGRHFVYTTIYTRFYMELLRQLKDRANLEQLARRVRRRAHDLFEHLQLWQDICTAYLQLLREYADLREGLETSTFSNLAHEDFLARKEPLEKWMQTQDPGAVPALDVLREVQELKKINQGIMKPGAIDDLIGDSYAQLFNTVGKVLLEDERRAKREEDASREAEKPPQVLSPPRNPMMSLTHLMNVDGSSDAPPNAPPVPPANPALGLPPPTEAAPARRKIGVGRREIRACAELCVQKEKAKSQSSSDATAQKIASAPRLQVLIERDRPSLSGEASFDNSAPGSIHDSADDESELSELEEADDEAEPEEGAEKEHDDSIPRPIFPGLASLLRKAMMATGKEMFRELLADSWCHFLGLGRLKSVGERDCGERRFWHGFIDSV
ncbi:hypothetical protein M409DRAFT_65826 [Zasmidium cellare ATCC 36951]|uniref:Histone transcription regulator 3 homolog n=1 Tax=Zasmidium cellare ATCC 36951 TaxID=1080233 RepID=A0A6A6CNI3_ZASCE|nr:uncharacterized protein M409DRAFT_65826 [Zasmidium cellare ATCC 36951]KAF2167700.1 hypothetical protein M409DRAFT_65826 [Zasmidium cellare ATCC 36951]